MDNGEIIISNMPLVLLKKIKVEVKNGLLRKKILSWLGDGAQNIDFLGSILAVIEEIEYKINLTGENIAHFSFVCFNKYGEVLEIRLDKDLLSDERIIIIENKNEKKEYICIIDKGEVTIKSINKINKRLNRKVLQRN